MQLGQHSGPDLLYLVEALFWCKGDLSFRSDLLLTAVACMWLQWSIDSGLYTLFEVMNCVLVTFDCCLVLIESQHPQELRLSVSRSM